MPYPAFRHALATRDAAAQERRLLEAGLLVLELVDRWIDGGPFDAAGARDAEAGRAVQRALDALPVVSAQRALLDSIVGALADERTVVAGVLPRLVAYGRTLAYDQELAAAADVFGRAAELARDPRHGGQPDLASDALFQRGRVLRVHGALDEAAAAYRDAEALAVGVGDHERRLRARVGLGKVALSRGELAVAVAGFDAVITEAESRGLHAVQAVAMHDRAAVAHALGEHDHAIRLLYRALALNDDPTSRDRLLADLAANFVSVGEHGAARDALVVLTLTAQDQTTRWQSEINLIDLATRERNEIAFAQHRRALVGCALPPELEAYYHLHVSRGLQAFGRDPEAARRTLAAAGALAAAHGFRQIAAQVALVEAEAGAAERPPALPLPGLTSPAVAQIVAAMAELREVVEVGS